MLFDPITPTRLYIKQCSHCELKYFGKHEGNNIEKYAGSGIRWLNHLKKHNATSLHIWNSDWYYDTSIKQVALEFSRFNNIVENDDWANLKEENGLDGGHPGPEGLAKMKEKINYKDNANKISKTRLNPEWQSTIGVEAKIKERKTKSDEKWINNVLIPSRLIAKKNTDWDVFNDKVRQGLNNPEYLAIKNPERKKKISERRTSVAWKEENYIHCGYCDKFTDPGNYKRWHGNNCKNKEKTNGIV